MLSLFSVFDPSTKFFSLNWVSSILIFLMFPQMYWIYKSRMIYFFYFLLINLFNEFKLLLVNKFNLLNILFFLSLFFFIMMNNFMGLFPYIFTNTSHIMFALGFSLSMWLGLMFFGWIFNSMHMFIHMVPMGTPFVLMFFMVLIETLSSIIRPLTLCIRLVANMLAGHLLLVLLSGFILPLPFYLIILFSQMLLLMLEMGVSFIQAYVFVILMVLYLKETN
uniref:ATP synthase subunit a n=1 Tax=Paroligoneurus sp. QL-2014 TaxID=1491722 RepID=A0A0U1WH23_9HYME|nr:ATP synthase F0 subunit 6 [Paroligoneurus sp. QL-2014]